MQHLQRDLFGRAKTGMNQHVGLVIRRRTLLQQFTDFSERIGCLQQGAVGLCANPFPNRFRRGPQTNHQRMSFEAREVLGVRNKTAPGRYDEVVSGCKRARGFFLQLAERDFAALGKNIGDGFPGMAFDPVIGIDEIEAQMFGGKTSNGRFSRAHEPDEGEIMNGALGLVLHGCI